MGSKRGRGELVVITDGVDLPKEALEFRRRRDDLAHTLDAAALTAHLYDRDDQSGTGISHYLCEHNVQAATCQKCIYGEAGNSAVIDLGMLEHIASEQDPLADDPAVRKALERAYRAGVALGSSDRRLATSTYATMRAVESEVPDAADAAVLLGALARGEVSSRDALFAVGRWAKQAIADLSEGDRSVVMKALSGGRE